MNVDSKKLYAVSEDFIANVEGLALGELKSRSVFCKVFKGITDDQLRAGVSAFTLAVGAYKRVGQVRDDVCEAMFGVAGFGVDGFPDITDLGFYECGPDTDYQEEYWDTVRWAQNAEARQTALEPFAAASMQPTIQFVDALARFDGVLRDVVYEDFDIGGGKIVNRQYHKYRFTSESRLAEALLDPDSEAVTMALRVKPFPSYNDKGVNSEGDSILLSSAHAGCVAGELAIKAVNAMQSNAAYESNPAIEMAAKAFGVIAEDLKKSNRAARTALRKRANKEGAQWDTDKLDELAICGIAASSAFISRHGSAYVQYKLDSRGRQYQLGPFSQLDSAAALLIANNPKATLEKLKRKLKVKRVDSLLTQLEKLLDDDLSALASFYSDAEAERVDGQKVIRYEIKPAKIAAACVLLASERANQQKEDQQNAEA